VTTSLVAGDFTAGAGTLAGNYTLPTTASGPGHISAVTVTASIVGDPTKPYDGNADATLAPANFSLAGLVGTESFAVTQTAGSYNSPNVATATTVTTSLVAGDFTAGAGTLAGNYTLPTTASGPGHIGKATVTANVTADPKPYDGNNTATASCTLNGVLPGDIGNVTCTASDATFGGTDAGPWTVTATLTLGGSASGNYNLTGPTPGPPATFDITPKLLTASIINDPTKPYDGNTGATLNQGNFSLSGLVGSEDFLVTKTTGSYNSPDVLSATTVTTDLAAGDFTPAGGAVATNYTLPTSASGPGHISQASSSTIVTGGTFTYDTFAHAATVSVTGVNLSLTPAPAYSGGCVAAPVNVSETTPTACTASYTFAGDANHSGSTGSATITINKAPTTTTVTNTNYLYTGSPVGGETAGVAGPGLSQALSVTYTGTAYLGSVAYGPSGTPPTNPGAYNAFASYGGGSNWLPSNGNANFTISILDANGDGIPDFISCSSLPQSRVVYKTGTALGTMLEAVLPASRRHASLQAAVTAAVDNDVIAMYASTTENAVIGSTTASGGKDLRIVGCGQKITGALLTKPVITVEVSGGANDGNTGAGERDIHIDDLDVSKGSIGYLVQTSKGVGGNNTSTLLKGIRSDSNTGGGLGIGIKIQGDGNEVRGANSVGSNTPGDGIQVIGNGNRLDSNRVMSNKGDGIDVTGSSNTIVSNKVGEKGTGNQGNGIVLNAGSNSNTVNENNVYASTLLGIKVTGNLNQVYKNDVGESGKGNLGGGILIAGNNNLLGKDLSENNVFANTGIGIQVTGDTNMIGKNDVGDSGKGNTGDGIQVTGSTNTLNENNVFANGGIGIKIAGNSNTLSKNDVGDKGKGNKLDGINVVGYGNTLTENDSFANGFNANGTVNGGDGFDISGGTAAKPNVLVKNNAGKNGAGNGGNGFLLAGAGNGTASPVVIELDQNTAASNTNDGFKATGTGWQFSNNSSDSNGHWEFEVVTGNFNATGNKANGGAIAGAMNSAFPTTAGTS
jgi:parallel beta-helix repeat protein